MLFGQRFDNNTKDPDNASLTYVMVFTFMVNLFYFHDCW